MQANFRISSLVPPGMAVHSADLSSDKLVLKISGTAVQGSCPLCGHASRRIHSQYTRRVCDYPCSGRGVEFQIITRRFVCDVPQCSRRIFAERFGEAVLADRSRRTVRLEGLVYQLVHALGGKPAARLSRRLMLPVSNDTLLRVVRRRTRAPTETLNVVGIDDWAWRRNYRYGSIVCDGEAAHRGVVARPGNGNGGSVDCRSSKHHGRVARSRRWLRRGDCTCFAEDDASRRSLASYGKCEWRVSGCRPRIDARYPSIDEPFHGQTRPSDTSRAHAV